MKTLLISLFSLLYLFSACNGKPGNQTEPKVISPNEVSLGCEAMQTEDEDIYGPRNQVYLQLGESRINIAVIQTCEVIGPADYAKYQIPAEAINAVGGWYAGFGDYLYVILEGDNYVVMQGGVDEEQEGDSYGYQSVFSVSNKKH